MLLPTEASSKLADYLLLIAATEQAEEAVRQQLNSSARFHPQTCFNAIALGKSSFQPTDLLFYLNAEDVVVDQDQLYALFKPLDPSRVSSAEPQPFGGQLLSKESSQLAKAVLKRVSNEVTREQGKLKGLDRESTAFLKMIFLKRIEAYHNYERGREVLFTDPDFSPEDAFFTLAQGRDLSVPALQHFFRRVGRKVSKEQLLRIMRGLNELSPSQTVSYSNFFQQLHPFYHGYYPAYYENYKERQSIAARVTHSRNELNLLEEERLKAALRIQQLSREIDLVKQRRDRELLEAGEFRARKEEEWGKQVELMSLEMQTLKANNSLAREKQRFLEEVIIREQL